MNGEMIIAIRQTIIRDVEIALIQIVPLVIAAFQAISIDGCRMIGKRKVGELKGKAIFITFQYQSLQTYRRNSRSSLDAFIKQGILCLPSIHHDTRQEQLCLLILRHIQVGTDRHEAIVATHHHLVVQFGIIDIGWSHHRDDESETVVLRIQHTTGVAGSYPDFSLHITHGNRFVANFPFLAIHILASRRQVDHVALYTGIISYPHIAIVGSHEIIDWLIAPHMSHTHGIRVDAVEMVISRCPDHSLAIEYHLSYMQARKGILSLV